MDGQDFLALWAEINTCLLEIVIAFIIHEVLFDGAAYNSMTFFSNERFLTSYICIIETHGYLHAAKF